MEPRRVLILDSVLDDTLKLNAVQIFKHAGERMGCEIELRGNVQFLAHFDSSIASR